MRTFYNFFTIIILITLVLSCKKENDQNSVLPKSYLNYDKFTYDGLIAYYPFNGNCNDYSGNELNGKPNEISFGTDRFGNPNGTCLLNGTDSYVVIKNSDLLNSDAYTICFWYRADLTDSLKQSILSKSDSLGFGYTFNLYNSGFYSSPGFEYKEKINLWGWTLLGSYFREWSSVGERPYEFIAIAFSKSEFIDYNRGTKESHQPPILFNNNNYDLLIGKSENKQYANYKGEIDDVLIYNRVLTIDEVQDLSDWNKEK